MTPSIGKFFKKHLSANGLASGWSKDLEELEEDIEKELHHIRDYDESFGMTITNLAKLTRNDLDNAISIFDMEPSKFGNRSPEAEKSVKEGLENLENLGLHWESTSHRQVAEFVRQAARPLLHNWSLIFGGGHSPSHPAISQLFDRGTACIRKMAFIADKDHELDEELTSELTQLGAQIK